MILNKVDIKNYRSIKEMSISFDPPCRILVGINESGKTNILDALSLLDPARVATPGDIREPGLREDQISEAYVRFVFKFTRDEVVALTQEVKSRILSRSHTAVLFKNGTTEFTISRFCETREGLYKVNLLENTKNPKTWTLSGAEIMRNWKKVGDKCPADFAISFSDTGPTLLKNFTLVDSSEYPEIPADYLGSGKVRAARTQGELVPFFRDRIR
jgi:AAA ATPase domain